MNETETLFAVEFTKQELELVQAAILQGSWGGGIVEVGAAIKAKLAAALATAPAGQPTPPPSA